MEQVVAMFCVFLVIVQTSEDMVLIRRVSQPVNPLLDLLRSKLISNNVDYDEYKPKPTPSTPTNCCINSVNTTSKHIRKLFNPYHDTEYDPSRYAIYNPYHEPHYNPYHHPHYKPLHNPGYAPFHRAPYAVYASLEPQDYKSTKLPVNYRSHRQTLQPSGDLPQFFHYPKDSSQEVSHQRSQSLFQSSPSPLSLLPQNPLKLYQYVSELFTKFLSHKSPRPKESSLHPSRKLSSFQSLPPPENLPREPSQQPFHRPPHPHNLQGQYPEEFYNQTNSYDPLNEQRLAEKPLKFRAYRFIPTSKTTTTVTIRTFPTNSLKKIKLSDQKSKLKVNTKILPEKNKINLDLKNKGNSSSLEVWENAEATLAATLKGFKLAPGVKPIFFSSDEDQRTAAAPRPEDLEKMLSQVMQRAERRGAHAQMDFQKYQNSSMAMRRANGYLQLKYAHGVV